MSGEDAHLEAQYEDRWQVEDPEDFDGYGEDEDDDQ